MCKGSANITNLKGSKVCYTGKELKTLPNNIAFQYS